MNKFINFSHPEILVKLHSSFTGSPKENIGKIVRIINNHFKKTPIVKECKPSQLISGILYKHRVGRYYSMLINF